MGDIQQTELIRSLTGIMQGPILEIGSKRYGGPPIFFDYRQLFPATMRYVGTDIEAGEGVDVVVDMTADISAIKERLGGTQFKSIICLSVMEHVKDIVSFARNVESLLDQDGMLILSVPFVWEIHAYPDDYWRFTPGALEFLYHSITFDPSLSCLHTDTGRLARLSDIRDDLNKFVKMVYKPSGPGKTIGSRFRIMAYSLARWALGLGKNPLYNTMINMVGYRKE